MNEIFVYLQDIGDIAVSRTYSGVALRIDSTTFTIPTEIARHVAMLILAESAVGKKVQ